MTAWIRRLIYSSLTLVRRDRREHELDEELRFHLEMQTSANVASGMPREDARRAALRTFGPVGLIKDECRDSWGLWFVDSVRQDVRFGLRNLARQPVFTTVIVLTMALGIGANTAIFSVVQGVILQPLPYAHGDRLVRLQQDMPTANVEDIGFSVPEIHDYRRQAKSLDGVVEYHNMFFILLGQEEPQRVSTGVVSADYFDVIGVKPILGRSFVPADDEPGAEAVLILSHSYWQRQFGGSAGVINRVFEMNDRPHTVIGVLPPLPSYPQEDDVYMPTSACPFRSNPQLVHVRERRMVTGFGRLKPESTLAQNRSDLQLLSSQLAQAYPAAYPPNSGFRATATPVYEELTREFKPTLLVLLATAGFVLLIVCASVANLMLARMVRRAHEMALRAALGAGRARLLRQVLTESVLVAVAGGLVGLVLAGLSLGLLVTLAERLTPRAAEITINGSVLAFTLVVSVLTGLVFGSIPGLASRRDVVPTLRDGVGRGATSRAGVLNTLIVGQVAISFVLLIGAGLMLRSLINLQQLDPGFRTNHVMTLRIALNFTKYSTPALRAAFYERLLERLGSEPGMIAVAGAGTFPLNELPLGDTRIEVEGRSTHDSGVTARAGFHVASNDYFRTIDVPLLRGRTFTNADDLEAPGVAIVNQSMARRYWSGDDPIGKRIRLGSGQNPPWLTVVGIVGDVRQRLASDPTDEVYRPLLQVPFIETRFLVRTQADAATAFRTVREAVRALDPNQPVDSFRTYEDVRSLSLSQPRLTALLLGVFAALALSITAAGIAGVIAFSVNQRTQEFGIRFALGALRRDVLALVLRQGLMLAIVGLAIGLAGALALARVIASLLFAVGPTDPLTFAAVSLVLLLVAAAACFMPARRAAKVDPIVALRYL